MPDPDISSRNSDNDRLAEAIALLGACAWPSEAYWRLLELAVVKQWPDVGRPVLELGCGDGMFTQLTGLHVDHAVDREARAVERAARRTEVYGSVSQMDIRELGDELGSFGTIFSNSVLEHVPDIATVLQRCRELLLPGGRLMTTVPLRDMNDHLACAAGRYARARQRQLQHRNLWSLDEWKASLEAAGFVTVAAAPYLDAAACRFWDRLDVVGALGAGRYRVAPVVHRVLSMALPASAKQRVKRRLGLALTARAGRASSGPYCAAFLVASVPR